MTSDHKPDGDGHGTAVEHERPEDWGWHSVDKGRATHVAGWIVVIFLLLMTIGNHEGHVEDLWLVGIAAIMAFFLVRDRIRRKNSWRS